MILLMGLSLGCSSTGDGTSTAQETGNAELDESVADSGDRADDNTTMPVSDLTEEGGGKVEGSDEGGESPVEEPVEEVTESIEEEGGQEGETEILTLTLISLTPNSGLGSGGEAVVVEGTGFASDAQVFFGESLAENIYVVDSKTISLDTPPRPAGLVDVRVLNPSADPNVPGEEAVLEDSFVFYNPVSVESVEPQQGPAEGGTPVSISGSGFAEGSKVLFGLKAAVNVEVIDDSTILAVSPIGFAGATDVHVSNTDGVGSKEKAYFYYEEPEIDLVSPPNGSILGGNPVTLTGKGFLAGALVRIGGELAETLESPSSDMVIVEAPPGVEGPVDVEVETGYGLAIMEGGYTYYDPTDDNTETILLGVSPNSGPSSGGDDVFLTAYGLTGLADTDVVFNDESAEVISVNPLTKTVHVKSPATDVLGWASITLSNSNGTSSLDEGYRYHNAVDVLSVAPGVGPIYGGSSITILGSGFEEGAEVRIGALPAIEVTVIDDSTIDCITPPGSPGFVPVQVTIGEGEGILDDAFFYQTDGMDVYLVSPNQGSIAGATLVTLIGSGFPSNAEVYVDGVLATHINVVDSTMITMKTPPGNVGTVDIEVVSPQGTATLNKSYTYFNPEAALGGTWGGEVDGDVNVTVRDSGSSAPIADAFVMLYTDPTTPYQGFTNLQGQITFSGDDLLGTQMVSASKEGYETNSVIEFDAENITIYLAPIPDPSSGTPPPGVGPPTVTGKIFGLDKYTIIPTGDCSTKVGAPGTLCDVCETDEQCQLPGSETSLCVQMKADDKVKHCASPCLAPSDCPAGFVCGASGGGAVCLPSPGQKVARCFSTKPRIFDQDIWSPDVLGVPGPGDLWEVTSEGDNYTVYAYPGEVAIVCYGGYLIYGHTPQPNESPYFEGFVPLTMGVARHVFTAPDQETPDKDVELQFMMDRDVTVLLEDPPEFPPDFQGLFTYLDFGSDGVIEMKHAIQISFLGDTLTVPRQVREFTGDIYDASFTFLGGAFSNTPDNTPMAMVLAREVTSIEDDTIFSLTGDNWTGVATGVKKNINGLWGTSESSVYGVGPAGAIYHYNGGGWTQQAVETEADLNDIFGHGPGNILAVGSAGTILRFDGLVWNQELVSSTTATLNGIWGSSQTDVYAVGAYAVQHFDGQQWKAKSLGSLPMREFTGVYGTSDSDMWVTARLGWIYTQSSAAPGEWTSLQFDHKEDLNDVWASGPEDVFVVGDGGTISHYNGIAWQTMESGVTKNLKAVWGSGPNEVYAVGDGGTILHYDGDAWSDQTPLEYTNALVAVWGAGPGHAITTGSHEYVLSPFLDVPIPKYPADGGVMSEYKIEFATKAEKHPASFQYVNIQIPGLMGPTPCWLTVTDGAINNYILPEFPTIEGTPGIPDGVLSLTVIRVFKPGFSLDNYDYSDFDTLQWRSWSVDSFNFIKQ